MILHGLDCPATMNTGMIGCTCGGRESMINVLQQCVLCTRMLPREQLELVKLQLWLEKENRLNWNSGMHRVCVNCKGNHSIIMLKNGE